MGYFTDIFEMNIVEAFAFHPILGIPIKILQYALSPFIYLIAITSLYGEYGKYTMIPLSLLCAAIGIILLMRLIRGKKGFGKKNIDYIMFWLVFLPPLFASYFYLTKRRVS